MPRYCEKSGQLKRTFRSAASARRSGKARYGHEVGVYRCACGKWHVTRHGSDPLLEQLAIALLGRKALTV